MVSSGDHDSSFSLAKCKAVYAKMLPSIKRHARIAFRYLDPEAKQVLAVVTYEREFANRSRSFADALEISA